MTETDVEKLKLMVVDDEPDNLELLYRTFRRDFQVYKANHAMKALEILDKEGEMAVIISDQRMPEMNGTEFLSLTVERFPDTIRILLTGFTDVKDLVDAINSGQVFKYITKPWKPDRLKEIVEQAADAYQLVKKRTQELRRALRRESLFNAVTTAIRESLDYSSMLEKIVATIGQSFKTSYCLLRPVESNCLTADEFSYLDPQITYSCEFFDASFLIEQVLETQHYQHSLYNNKNDNPCYQLAVPLIYQQHLLAVLALYETGRDQPWQDEDIQLITGVAEQAALALSQAKLYQRLQEKQQQIRAELEIARQIQNNLLRQSLPDIKGAKVQARCYPAREVGGDFFEVFVHPKGDLWLAVGDVSGKGVPAALFMASAISVLRRELSQETPAMPNMVIQNLNKALGDDLISSNCFITLILARYTPSTRELVYANAGHIYPLLWSRETDTDNPQYLKIRSIPLGILPKWQADFGQLFLAPKDILLFTSDGITEAMVTTKTCVPENSVNGFKSNHRSMLHLDGLWQLLQQETQPLSLNHLLARIQADNNIQEDDQTILSLEVF
ncbi:fused response regulator/phosphatase [Fischerella thermalis WC542]|uniref:SpoIIE family protein phosphatase n=1 Tax=Fischerella thermalis TaxID=372787 RepID=UPI000C8057F1|nr:SpoIIE family protein phosphatase [Fischerella thermalis]PLZ23810.1 fused response regulator/phosphatase [Fischerella thermalis WC559]PLZ27357.1 fused response regulator/phosphatase [Fischerella thermalis WC558]PLZ31382.1 fused response regulator/phosphatase [Fischerella thermalis WC542]PLZ58023.1 fused response regulator/phosphatase [Fischerella thermalis WC439]